MEHVDARGLSCPEPAILARAALEKSGADEVEVLVDSVTSKDNVLRMGRHMGWEGTCEQSDAGGFRVLFRRHG